MTAQMNFKLALSLKRPLGPCIMCANSEGSVSPDHSLFAFVFRTLF